MTLRTFVAPALAMAALALPASAQGAAVVHAGRGVEFRLETPRVGLSIALHRGHDACCHRGPCDRPGLRKKLRAALVRNYYCEFHRTWHRWDHRYAYYAPREVCRVCRTVHPCWSYRCGERRPGWRRFERPRIDCRPYYAPAW